MSEREAFIEAIAAHPDEDTPRLVFADWLQENGEADRAEFIRFQYEALYSLYLPARNSRFVKLREHAREVFRLRWPFWIGPFCRALGVEEIKPPARRRGLLTRAWEKVVGRPRPAGYEIHHCFTESVIITNWGEYPLYSLLCRRGLFEQADISFQSPGLVRDIETAFKLEPVTHLGIDLGPNPSHWQRVNQAALRRVRALDLHMPDSYDSKKRSHA